MILADMLTIAFACTHLAAVRTARGIRLTGALAESTSAACPGGAQMVW